MTVDNNLGWIPDDTFASRLVHLRRQLNMTVKEAAGRCGLNYGSWSNWENGTKPADKAGVVQAITTGLQVDRDWLMWGVIPEPDPRMKMPPARPRPPGIEDLADRRARRDSNPKPSVVEPLRRVA